MEGATETLRRLFELMPHDLDTVLILDEMYRDTHRFDDLLTLTSCISKL